MTVDGRSFWNFVETWAEICRAGGLMKPEVEGGAVVHYRSLIGCPSSDSIKRHFINCLAASNPFFWRQNTSSTEAAAKLSRRTFLLTFGNIKSLKERATSTTTTVSTFVAIVTHIWITAIQAKKLHHEDTTGLIFSVACRARLQPPMSPNFFGNCIKVCTVKAMSGELIKGGDNGLSFACMALQEEIRKIGENPLEDLERWIDNLSGLPQGRMVIVSRSPRFQVYDMDFGWGRPAKVEMVSLTFDGHVNLCEGKEKGSIQVSIALPPSQMDTFASMFLVV